MKKDNSRKPFFDSKKSDSSDSKKFQKGKPAPKSKFGSKDSDKKSFGPKKDWKKSDASAKWDKEDKPGKRPNFRKDEGKFPNSDQGMEKKRFFGAKPESGSESGDFKREPFKKSFKKDFQAKPEGDKPRAYLGRGKDQKPIYGEKEVGRSPKLAGKKGFGKNRPNRFEMDQNRPDYNFDALPAKKSKGSEGSDLIRLNKYIANSGICSRREADELIAQGLVTVNNEVITELGYKVKKADRVVYQGRRINPEKPVYVLLNKPKDFITTTEDPMERKTVMKLVENACEERIFPVGRLDRNTTGLLLFTNDGELAAKLSHPSNEIKKIYQVTLDKPLTKKDEEAVLEGLTLEDGPANVDDMQVLSKDRKILGLEIHIGRNRIVRRIFAHLGYEVTALDRVMFAGLDKKDLKRGHYRFLSEKEVIKLKFFV
ncbi:pseudouridine synthase [Algoriphagus algorifonticola]|uniref:pseudouridine synthase n=1 Tax=Algoriphagus algorifonticola TaxID=2593007 RepID=UPI0011A03387|nr:pseudouridine synthase [Algoriphagus algorifonticola]